MIETPKIYIFVRMYEVDFKMIAISKKFIL